MSKKKLAAIIVACTIAIIVIVVIATRPPAQSQFNTYSKYGFSFQYPKNFSITEVEVFGREVNNNSGMVQASVENLETGENETFQVTWIEMELWAIETVMGDVESYLKAELQGALAGFRYTEGVVSLDTGELVESTKSGHLMFYQYFAYNSTEGDEVYGVYSCFYCDKSQKGFILITMSNTISADEDVLENFQNYLDSFVCH